MLIEQCFLEKLHAHIKVK